MGLIYAVLFAGLYITVSEGCIDGWVQHNDMCYFLSHDKATWYEALAVCSSVFGTLAEPSSADLQNFLVSQIPKNSSFPHQHFKYWIGISDVFKETHWMFISTQQLVSKTFWYPGEPNNNIATGLDNTDEDCVLFNWDGKGSWNDFSCTSRYLFICQKEDADVNVIG
ncbi:CD209 antigen-like protein 2 [Mytilus galloprovincialis]|uniref:C-type lectin superfamily 17 member A n=1 Tax=Mytilus galloprovincialis TaxID=29158 RepID=A0A8B6CAY8_MYTGA|nr:C-type lectin superfamily 17 member A [Mytilus galloprovincialis]